MTVISTALCLKKPSLVAGRFCFLTFPEKATRILLPNVVTRICELGICVLTPVLQHTFCNCNKSWVVLNCVPFKRTYYFSSGQIQLVDCYE